MLKTISQTIFSLVFPLHCHLCAELLPGQRISGVCRACEDRVRLIEPPHCHGCGRTSFSENELCGRCSDEKYHFDRAFACVVYEPGIKGLMHGFKFGRKKFLAGFISATMEKFADRYMQDGTWDLVAPVPMDHRRRLDRGFDQSRLLSAAIAKKLALPHAPGILGCAPSKKPQAFLNKPERRSNVQGRFFLNDATSLSSRHVLLIDDILTTGQTASACAKVLKAAGARSVTVFTFARGV